MQPTYTKLFSSITDSTIWCESADTRVVWITMLAMCDRFGRVAASIPGLAKRSQVTLKNTEIALELFLSPDKYSRTKDHEGRRIEEIPGGWRLLNHSMYRDLRDEEDRKAYKREWIANKRAQDKVVDCVVDNVDKSRPQSTHTDTDTDTDIQTTSAAPSDPKTELWRLAKQLLGEKCGSLIGKKIKECGEKKVFAALGETAGVNPAEPREYFCGLLKNGGNGTLTWGRLQAMSSPEIMALAEKYNLPTYGKENSELFPKLIEAYNHA